MQTNHRLVYETITEVRPPACLHTRAHENGDNWFDGRWLGGQNWCMKESQKAMLLSMKSGMADIGWDGHGMDGWHGWMDGMDMWMRA